MHNLCMAEASGECGITVDKSKGVDKDTTLCLRGFKFSVDG